MARRSTNGAPTRASLKNDDWTDREVLANINDVVGPDGWATTTDIARAHGFTGGGGKSSTPAIKVSSRLSWMRAGGLLESTGPDLTVPYKEPGDRDTRWRLTDVGQEILQGNLSRAVTNAIERMDPGTQILMMGQLTQRGYIEGDTAVAFALKRQYQHNIAKRKLVYRTIGR